MKSEKRLVKKYLSSKDLKKKFVQNYCYQRKRERKLFPHHPNQITIYPFTNYLLKSKFNNQIKLHSFIRQLLFSLIFSENQYQVKHCMHQIEEIFTKTEKNRFIQKGNPLEQIIDDGLVTLGFLFGIFNPSRSSKFNLEYSKLSKKDLVWIFDFYDFTEKKKPIQTNPIITKTKQQTKQKTKTKTIEQQKYENLTNYKVECMLRIIEIGLSKSLFKDKSKIYQLIFRFALQCFLTFPQYRRVVYSILKQCIAKLGEQFTGNTAIYCFKFFNDLQLLNLLREFSPLDPLLRKEHLWFSSLALRNVLNLTINIIPEDLPKNIHQELILSIELFQNKQVNDQVINLKTFVQLLYILPLVQDLCLEQENQKFCKKLRNKISDIRQRIRNSTKEALKIKEILLEIYVTLKNGEKEMKAKKYNQQKIKNQKKSQITIKMEKPMSNLFKNQNHDNRKNDDKFDLKREFKLENNDDVDKGMKNKGIRDIKTSDFKDKKINNKIIKSENDIINNDTKQIKKSYRIVIKKKIKKQSKYQK
ncbi:hypothetical protein M0812_10122 [Anaeramoeba flamelloides]|uniref:Uncharacterized protein n=1 Tax=Anaeramoeba flamelloides TaxID=1746091 RepID=A0AAV7ZQL8_9EUKA|nr:hypothetical protein M0812_10122 [Anaeramoeba flamelloides]